ncbi:uncharacterized protein LOC122867078 [Scomber scombrus]|uniref:Uncharacterized protein LOC122867078 n=1 Tax=Scomber scombrus TaxID=13677 RepID=A0AAV1MXU4_SCOSC
MEALSGSCLQIPCNFSAKVAEEFDGSRETIGIWMKNNHKKENEIFRSSQAVNPYPMKMTGNLKEKNCTTLFSNLTTTYTDTYFFRIEKEQYKATAVCDPLQITVKGKEPAQWGPVVGGIIGGIIGGILLIGVVVVIWQFKFRHPTSQQTQSLPVDQPPLQEPVRTTEEDIKYGEIVFSKRRPEPSSVQDSGQQQDTTYAQIKVSEPPNLTQTADLYAEVIRLMAALSTNMLAVNMLLSVFFLPGALAACLKHPALFITAPLKMEALSGSCLQIPCNFSAKVAREFDGSRQTFGVWIKSHLSFGTYPENVIFNSSQTVNPYPMKITGNLNETNCTTLFSNLNTTYTDKYFFRIENRPFLATADCDPLQITVTDSPPSPTIEISGELKEKESVTITCSAFIPCPHSPPKLTWNLQQDAHNKIEENTDRTFTTKIQKTITLSDKQDGYTITCSSIYSVNEGQNVKSAEGKVTLNVSYAPKDTSAMISPSGLVSPGSWVNLTCSSRAKPTANFTWFKINKDGLMKVSEGDFYRFNVTDGGNYYCVASNDVGNQSSSQIHLTIKEVKQPHSPAQWGPVVGGIIGGILLIGLVVVIWQFKFRHPPSQQTQSLPVEQPPLQEPVRTTEEDIKYGEIVFSKQRPEPSSVQDSGQQQDTTYAQIKVSEPPNLTQTADLYAEVMNLMAALSTNMLAVNMLLSVFFLPGALAACPEDSALFITAPRKMEALSGSCLQIPCNFSAGVAEEFDGSRQTIGIWMKKGHKRENEIFRSSQAVNTHPMNITGNLNEKNCTTLFSNLITTYTDRYYFRIENRPFLATAVCDPLQITVTDSPPSPTIEIPGELKERESVTITCSAFTPCTHSPPKLTWNLQQDAHNKIDENTDRTFTTKIQKTITLSDKQDGYTITCSSIYSVNEGQNVKSAEGKVTLNVSYAPKNTSAMISPSGLVSPGSWVNLTCSSRAKPAANFTWFKINKDGPMKVSEGDFYSFNVTDGGVYYCLATNNVGNQMSSEIHLTIKEPEMSFQWGAVLGGIIGIIVLICLVVCVSILVSLRYSQSINPTSQQTQGQTGDKLAVEEPASKAEEEKEEEGGENIHYGEIEFHKSRSEPSSVQDSIQQQDTVYAQIKVSEPTNSLTQTTDSPENLYAQVKKK